MENNYTPSDHAFHMIMFVLLTSLLLMGIYGINELIANRNEKKRRDKKD